MVWPIKKWSQLKFIDPFKKNYNYKTDPEEQVTEEKSEYSSVNSKQQNEDASFNAEEETKHASEKNKKYEDANVNPEDQVAYSSANKVNHDKSKAVRKFDIDINVVDEY